MEEDATPGFGQVLPALERPIPADAALVLRVLRESCGCCASPAGAAGLESAADLAVEPEEPSLLREQENEKPRSLKVSRFFTLSSVSVQKRFKSPPFPM